MPRKILIVEDDEDDKDFLESCLKNVGFTDFISFTNAVSAINYLNETADLPRLIITDSQLPGMSGVEFVRELKLQQKVSSIKVITFTGGTTVSKSQKLLSAGVDAVFVKPTNMNDYQVMINKFVSMANEKKF